MFHKIPSIIFCLFVFFSFPCMAMEHFEHYRNLQLQSQVSQIKTLLEDNQDRIPEEVFKDLMLHIRISQTLLNEVYSLNDVLRYDDGSIKTIAASDSPCRT